MASTTDPGRAVHEHGPGQGREPRAGRRQLAGNVRGARDRRPGERSGPSAVGSEDDIGIEHPQERLEIAGPRCREEGVDYASLNDEIRIGVGRLHLDPAPGP
jgi:hypothetical protein